MIDENTSYIINNKILRRQLISSRKHVVLVENSIFSEIPTKPVIQISNLIVYNN